MWKTIILSALLSIHQGACVNDIYGNYSFVLVYPKDIITEPACGAIAFSEDPRNIECSCSDGSNCTLMKINLLDRELPVQSSIVNIKPVVLLVPVLVVDNVFGVPLVNVSCSYANYTSRDRSVIEIVSKNYILSYVTTNTNDTLVFLMARELPSASELELEITQIDKIKDKDWSRLCTREIYDQLHVKN